VAAGALARTLGELLGLEREIVELEYVRRADALERVRDAVRALGEVGSSTGIVERAAEELGASSGFDRVLISEVGDARLAPRALWADGIDAVATIEELRRAPIPLEYPSVEAEVVRHHRVEIVAVDAAGARAAPRLAEVLGWRSYAVGAVAVHGATVGMLHAAATARALDAVDAEALARFADGLAGVLERAILRDTLRSHRRELQVAVQWMSGRLSRLADAGAGAGAPAAAAGAGRLDALTPRELDVLRLLARGQTNAAIAETLVVGEGTVKYHVKNILRKLGATNRAEAVSRYLRTGDGGR
jgi:LuxR family transcriptional regulator, regulator of acetate metabolism